MVTNLKQAKKSDVSTIIQFLKEMNDETKEFNFDKKLFTQSVTNSFDENVHWFLFMDERKTPFGLCYLQSVHNYWRLEKRFYLGGFYITSSHHKKGYFKTLNQQQKTGQTTTMAFRFMCTLTSITNRALMPLYPQDLKKLSMIYS